MCACFFIIGGTPYVIYAKRSKVFLLQEYVYEKEEEVKDPISFSGSSFNKVMEQIYTAVKDLYKKIK